MVDTDQVGRLGHFQILGDRVIEETHKPLDADLMVRRGLRTHDETPVDQLDALSSLRQREPVLDGEAIVIRHRFGRQCHRHASTTSIHSQCGTGGTELPTTHRSRSFTLRIDDFT
jgi:hypothetical protein